MVQLILVIGLFVVASVFIGKRFYNQFSGKKQSGCEKCAAKQIVSR